MSTVDKETEAKTLPKSKRVACSVRPFSVEITGNGSDVIIQSIPGCKVRGAIKPTKKVFKPHGGMKTTTAPSGNIPGIPDVPGIRLEVNPGRCTCKLVDPLVEEVGIRSELEAALMSHGRLQKGQNINGVPERTENLDPSRMKTLVRELVRMIDCDMAKMHRGECPKEEDIEKLKGHFLLNPGSQVHNSQPRYEKDLPEYLDRLQRVGG